MLSERQFGEIKKEGDAKSGDKALKQEKFENWREDLEARALEAEKTNETEAGSIKDIESFLANMEKRSEELKEQLVAFTNRVAREEIKAIPGGVNEFALKLHAVQELIKESSDLLKEEAVSDVAANTKELRRLMGEVEEMVKELRLGAFSAGKGK